MRLRKMGFRLPNKKKYKREIHNSQALFFSYKANIENVLTLTCLNSYISTRKNKFKIQIYWKDVYWIVGIISQFLRNFLYCFYELYFEGRFK
jgi:hypothetical protein